MIDNDGEARASGIDFKGLRQRWATLGIDEAWIHSRGEQLERPDWCNDRWSINDPHFDRVCADGPV